MMTELGKNKGFFFFNDTATTEIYPLSLHDALPISDVLKAAGILGPLIVEALKNNQIKPEDVSEVIRRVSQFLDQIALFLGENDLASVTGVKMEDGKVVLLVTGQKNEGQIVISANNVITFELLKTDAPTRTW